MADHALISGLENSMDYGLWGLTESDTTEQLSTGLPGGQKLEKKTTVLKINFLKKCVGNRYRQAPGMGTEWRHS